MLRRSKKSNCFPSFYFILSYQICDLLPKFSSHSSDESYTFDHRANNFKISVNRSKICLFSVKAQLKENIIADWKKYLCGNIILGKPTKGKFLSVNLNKVQVGQGKAFTHS